jgi:hypothetical protein
LRIQKTERHDRLSILYFYNKNIPLPGAPKKSSQSCLVKITLQARSEGPDLPDPRRPHEGSTRSTAELSSFLYLRPAAVAEPGPRSKHRLAIMHNDIVGTRITYKPQKLQAMSATTQGRCGNSRKRAGRNGCHARSNVKHAGSAGEPLARGGRWAPGASAGWQRFSRGVQAACWGRAGSG